MEGDREWRASHEGSICSWTTLVHIHSVMIIYGVSFPRCVLIWALGRCGGGIQICDILDEHNDTFLLLQVVCSIRHRI